MTRRYLVTVIQYADLPASLVRHRMTETGEKYTTALRAIRASPAEKKRLRLAEQEMRVRMRYPFTWHDELGARHVLSAWETQRRKH